MKVIIEKLPPHDGTYDLDIEVAPFTTREWGWIKRQAGYLVATIDEGLAGIDPELVAVFAVIALRRAGRIATEQIVPTFEQIQDAPFDGSRVRLELDTTNSDGDADPPTDTNSSSKTDSSGAASPTGSERSGNHQNPTGDPTSAISVFVPPMSVS